MILSPGHHSHKKESLWTRLFYQSKCPSHHTKPNKAFKIWIGYEDGNRVRIHPERGSRLSSSTTKQFQQSWTQTWPRWVDFILVLRLRGLKEALPSRKFHRRLVRSDTLRAPRSNRSDRVAISTIWIEWNKHWWWEQRKQDRPARS